MCCSVLTCREYADLLLVAWTDALTMTCTEMASCCFRVASLGLRLNCNMLAGHVLLTIIAMLLGAVRTAVQSVHQ